MLLRGNTLRGAPRRIEQDQEYMRITLHKTIILLFSLLLISALQVLSQNISFTASVDNNRVALGEQFEITFSLGGTSAGSNFQPPPFTDFLVVGGPNQSTSMQFINGSVSSSVSWSYVLQPKAEGKFAIGRATIDYGGKKLQTQPVGIEVAKGSSQPAPQGRQQ